jgi:RNA polymerase sigma-70 factor, ECF subfamily
VIPLPTSNADEAGCLVRAQSGDLLAFRSLVMAHQARVFSIAMRLTGSRADAEELGQDVFAQLHASLAQICSADHLQHWLLRTTSHRCIDRLRQRERQVPVVSLDSLRDESHPQSPDTGGDPLAGASLQRLLMQLSAEARAVMVLRFQEDMAIADIAASLSMPLNTVKSHLRRSLEWLRTQCGGEIDEY